MFTVLKNTTYRHLFLAQVIALIGTGLITIALALLAYDMAGEKAAQVLGIALAIKMIAYIAVAPVASAFAERLPRKKGFGWIRYYSGINSTLLTICNPNLADLPVNFYFTIRISSIYPYISGNDSRCIA